MRYLFLSFLFMVGVSNLFSLAIREEKNGIQGSSSEANGTITQSEADMEITVKIQGKVQIYGNEPHTFVGIVDQDGIEYVVFLPSDKEELKTLQGHLVEFTLISPDEPQGDNSLSFKGETVTPVRWKIIQWRLCLEK